MEPDVVIRPGTPAQDARRLLNAHLHRLHLAHGTLCVHAAAMRHPRRDAVIMLLGGHGAGKTLVALKLALQGWQAVAGDVSLLDCAPGRASVSGGTRALLARRAAVRRWFPELALPAHGQTRVELGGLPALAGLGWSRGGALEAAVVVAVDGDPQPADCAMENLNPHTAETTWLRASGHLLDRVLEREGPVLREFEDATAAGRRLALLRGLSARMPLRAMWGSPHRIADRIERLVARPRAGMTGDQ
ncbi:hypothetical protein GCM10009716_06620 [Streptomyces sodiiphilus]|uniref:HPr kinase/phosphorylase C-terminal domain-containing protein n=1 Tax=Streptomyces sodiiphilus TaxID=226217 RepID=A0ABN2NUY6_9ACTN